MHPGSSLDPKTVREIFTSALECDDPAERQQLIETRCGADDQLKTEVQALLAECEDTSDFLETAAVEFTGDPAGHGVLPPMVGEEPGAHIGPYKLIELVGEGGGGTVYLARQSEPVRRRVALKILKPGTDTRSVIARFEAERQALALMDHPSIARVLDAGATERGRPYFVMDYVRGVPITDYCDAYRLTLDERFRLLAQVCRAVQHAHQKGIIHRDLKPSNILVTEHDGKPVPKIIDFGVAKAINLRLSEDTIVTRSEMMIGTPAYMSPEQAEIGGLDIDTRSDVYSLGVLLYELITGRTPFDARELEAASFDELRHTIREVTPARPSARIESTTGPTRKMIADGRRTEPARLASAVRGDLDWIAMKCLEKERSRRYATAVGLALELERYLSGEPVQARPPSNLYRLGKLVRRHRAMVVAGATVLLVLISGVVVSSLLAVRATNAEQEAVEAKDEQSQLRAAAERESRLALQSAREARLNGYIADINLAHLALLDGNFGKALTLLEEHGPGSEESRQSAFEWRYLAQLGRGDEHLSLPVRQSAVQALAWSPRGNLLAIGTRDELVVWDVRLGRQVFPFPGRVSSLAFFPDGNLLAAANEDETWIIDLRTGDEVPGIPRGFGSPISLSPDGLLLATVREGEVVVWDTITWSALPPFDEATGPVTFSPDSRTLVTNSPAGIKLWPVRGARSGLVLENSPRIPEGLAGGNVLIDFSPDGRYVIAPHNTRTSRGIFFLSVWNAATGAELVTIPEPPGLEGHSAYLSTVRFARDGGLLATSSWDHSVCLWDFAERELRYTLRGHRGEVLSLAISPDGRSVATGSKNGEIKIWPTDPRSRRDDILGNWKPLAFSPDNLQLAALNRNDEASDTLTILDLAPPYRRRDVPLQVEPSRFAVHVTLSSDFRTLAEALPDGTVRISDIRSGELQRVPAASRQVRFLALSPDGTTLLTQALGEELKWWNLHDARHELVRSLPGSRALFSADGSTLATFGGNVPISVWDLASGELRSQPGTRRRSDRFQLALSPDGSLLAMTLGPDDFENAVNLWDTSNGALVGSCTGHKQQISSVAFSPDGATLASSSADGTLRLWNVTTRRELLSLQEVGTEFTNLLFSPDGRFLVAATPPFEQRGRLHLLSAPAVE